jgi:metal-responsive CopG/Arc/MetJ family transcriptional regulator
MLHRIGISMSDADFKELKALQKRFGLNSRSEVFRELVKRFREKERRSAMLSQVVEAYRRHPETPQEVQESDAILQSLAKDWPAEEW